MIEKTPKSRRAPVSWGEIGVLALVFELAVFALGQVLGREMSWVIGIGVVVGLLILLWGGAIRWWTTTPH